MGVVVVESRCWDCISRKTLTRLLSSRDAWKGGGWDHVSDFGLCLLASSAGVLGYHFSLVCFWFCGFSAQTLYRCFDALLYHGRALFSGTCEGTRQRWLDPCLAAYWLDFRPRSLVVLQESRTPPSCARNARRHRRMICADISARALLRGRSHDPMSMLSVFCSRGQTPLRTLLSCALVGSSPGEARCFWSRQACITAAGF